MTSGFITKMATVVLPEALAYCINLALRSGLQLSWKVQDSSFGTSVQLLWKRNRSSGAEPAVIQLATGGPNLSRSSSSRKKRKSPSQIRRSRKRLEDFLQRKARDNSGTHLDRARDATGTDNDQDGDSHNHMVSAESTDPTSNVPVPPLDVDLVQCDSVIYQEREGIPGVQYITDNNEEGWTPVRKLRRGRTRNRDDSPDSVSGDKPESDTEDFVLPVTTKAVRFLAVNGTPGLHVTTRNTKSWTPIAARTRTKLHVI